MIAPSSAAFPRPVEHVFSHGHLLVHPGPTPSGDVLAIVVPTIRPSAAMRESLRLGRLLDRPVVALCSWYSSADAVRKEAELLGAQVVAVDLTTQTALPDFACDRMLAAQKHLNRANDVGVKRNLGLAVALMMGWTRAVFVDDDITNLEPGAIRTAGGLLRKHRVAALRNVGYPDNSVVCHARREVGLPQDVFVGGGAMAIRVGRSIPFFPTIYNEDWLFLVSRRGIERVAVCGKVSQADYDPFLSPERARVEEFGDCLAEGLFALWNDRPVQRADVAYWREFLDARIAMIDEILRLLRRGKNSDRIAASLRVARGRCQIIDPGFCVEYLAAWQSDQEVWRRFLAGLPRFDDPVAAFEWLGLTAYVNRPAGRPLT